MADHPWWNDVLEDASRRHDDRDGELGFPVSLYDAYVLRRAIGEDDDDFVGPENERPAAPARCTEDEIRVRCLRKILRDPRGSTRPSLHGSPAMAARLVAATSSMRHFDAVTGIIERRFQPEHAEALHARDRAFIEAELAIPFAGPTVVVTHHAPHPGSVAARYARDPVTPGFVSDLGDVIRRGRPAIWIHGHVHDGFDYSVGATRVLANPKGYGPRRRGGSPENRTFDPDLVVEVPHPKASGSGARTGGAAQAHPSPQTIAVFHWTILQIRADGHRHVLGYRIDTRCGRWSSPIRSFDRATTTATTASGNRYVLVGEPSEDGVDDVLVLAWLAIHDLTRRDVERVDIDDLSPPAIETS